MGQYTTYIYKKKHHITKKF